MKRDLILFGYGSGVGARHSETSKGPVFVKERFAQENLPHTLIWENILTPDPLVAMVKGIAALTEIHRLSERLAECTSLAIRNHKFPVVIGGDHSCAVGTWSGVVSAFEDQGPLGLIWIDAHMDSHVVDTSPSGNVHGMPLAALLGHGDAQLTQVASTHPKFRPEHVCLIGIRDYESEERALLEALNVRVYYMEEVQARSLQVVLREARAYVTRGTVAYGLSIDVDGFDKADAPGVGTAVENGIRKAEFMRNIDLFVQDPRLIALEIAEFNPDLDIDDKTYYLVADILMKFAEGERRLG